MEFWGVEVKSGESLKVAPVDGMILHLSQACVGELKKDKGNETVCMFVNVQGKKLVLGTLFTDKLPQQQFDLVFDKEFEISHNWKGGSVYFYGYQASNPFEDEELPEGDSDESDSDAEIPLTAANNNGKPEPKSKKDKAAESEKVHAPKGKESDASKQKVKIVEPTKEDDESSDDNMSDNDGVENDSEDDDDSDDSDDSDESGDEETPKKAEISKKRPAESATKTPVQDKKAKVTPQKTDGKKVTAHIATPHPAAKQGKTPANKPNQQTPKSGGSHPCKSCNKTFGSENALESHSKAKHASKK